MIKNMHNLPMPMLIVCTQFLGQQNITNAYVSGMKEDLNAQGNELNYFVVACMSDRPLGNTSPILTIQTIRRMS